MGNLSGDQIVRTVWHVSVTARQRQLNMEKKVKESHDILLKKFLIDFLAGTTYNINEQRVVHSKSVAALNANL